MPIKIFADGADLEQIRELASDDKIAGFTTNPSLLAKAGVRDYRAFGREALALAGTKSVSLEVFSDDLDEMRKQAMEIASWGANAFVKIPVTNTEGRSTADVVRFLSRAGIRLNVTAVFTEQQVRTIALALSHHEAPAVVSVFAGRVADAGHDPYQHVRDCRALLRCYCPRTNVAMLWASPRQVYDVLLAERAGCEIITMTPDLIAKMALFGKDLEEYSRETVEMFYRDARTAGYEL